MKTIPFSQLYKSEYFLKNIRTDFQFWRSNSSWSTPADGRINTAVMMILSKNAVYRFDNGTVLSAGCGDIVLMPKASIYTCTFYETSADTIDLRFQGFPRTCLFLGFDLFDSSFEPATVADKAGVIFSADTHDFFRSFVKLCKIRHRPECTKSLMAVETMAFLNSLSKKYAGALSDNVKDGLDDAIGYIYSNLDNVTPGKLTEICGMSPSTLRRRFSAKTGMTPTAYINSVKVEKAKTLLESGITKIRDVAGLCGFADEFYFSRTFTKYVGMPPTAYCKMINFENK